MIHLSQLKLLFIKLKEEKFAELFRLDLGIYHIGFFIQVSFFKETSGWTNV